MEELFVDIRNMNLAPVKTEKLSKAKKRVDRIAARNRNATQNLQIIIITLTTMLGMSVEEALLIAKMNDHEPLI
jgi:hypothetical protein